MKEFHKENLFLLNPFQANVPLMEKPGERFLPAKFLKGTCGRVTF